MESPEIPLGFTEDITSRIEQMALEMRPDYLKKCKYIYHFLLEEINMNNTLELANAVKNAENNDASARSVLNSVLKHKLTDEPETVNIIRGILLMWQQYVDSKVESTYIRMNDILIWHEIFTDKFKRRDLKRGRYDLISGNAYFDIQNHDATVLAKAKNMPSFSKIGFVKQWSETVVDHFNNRKWIKHLGFDSSKCSELELALRESRYLGRKQLVGKELKKDQSLLLLFEKFEEIDAHQNVENNMKIFEPDITHTSVRSYRDKVIKNVDIGLSSKLPDALGCLDPLIFKDLMSQLNVVNNTTNNKRIELRTYFALEVAFKKIKELRRVIRILHKNLPNGFTVSKYDKGVTTVSDNDGTVMELHKPNLINKHVEYNGGNSTLISHLQTVLEEHGYKLTNSVNSVGGNKASKWGCIALLSAVTVSASLLGGCAH